MKLRLGTFNVENLLTRQRFQPQGGRTETDAAMSLFHFPRAEDRAAVERSLAVALEDDKRQMTALALAEAKADLWMLQEVDSLASLQAFFANYVHRIADHRYGHFTLLGGNDRRNIEISFTARRDLLTPQQVVARSYKDMTFAEAGVRDAALRSIRHRPAPQGLRARLPGGGAGLRRPPAHPVRLPSQIHGCRPLRWPQGDAAAAPGRGAGGARIITTRFGEGWREANWAVLGDLNCYRYGLGPLAQLKTRAIAGWSRCSTISRSIRCMGLPVHERWTHFHRGWSESLQALTETHAPLDYILLSPALAAANPEPAMQTIRRGLPYRVPLDPRAPDRSIATLATSADRYPRIGWDRPKASDHCPLTIDLTIPKS